MEQNLEVCELNDKVGGKNKLWGMETMEKGLEHGQWNGGPGEFDGKTWLRMDLFDFLERNDDEVRLRQVATKSEWERVNFKDGVW